MGKMEKNSWLRTETFLFYIVCVQFVSTAPIIREDNDRKLFTMISSIGNNNCAFLQDILKTDESEINYVMENSCDVQLPKIGPNNRFPKGPTYFNYMTFLCYGIYDVSKQICSKSNTYTLDFNSQALKNASEQLQLIEKRGPDRGNVFCSKMIKLYNPAIHRLNPAMSVLKEYFTNPKECGRVCVGEDDEINALCKVIFQGWMVIDLSTGMQHKALPYDNSKLPKRNSSASKNVIYINKLGNATLITATTDSNGNVVGGGPSPNIATDAAGVHHKPGIDDKSGGIGDVDGTAYDTATDTPGIEDEAGSNGDGSALETVPDMSGATVHRPTTSFDNTPRIDDEASGIGDGSARVTATDRSGAYVRSHIINKSDGNGHVKSFRDRPVDSGETSKNGTTQQNSDNPPDDHATKDDDKLRTPHGGSISKHGVASDVNTYHKVTQGHSPGQAPKAQVSSTAGSATNPDVSQGLPPEPAPKAQVPDTAKNSDAIVTANKPSNVGELPEQAEPRKKVTGGLSPVSPVSEVAGKPPTSEESIPPSDEGKSDQPVLPLPGPGTDQDTKAENTGLNSNDLAFDKSPEANAGLQNTGDTLGSPDEVIDDPNKVLAGRYDDDDEDVLSQADIDETGAGKQNLDKKVEDEVTQNLGTIYRGGFVDAEDSHFFAYFLTVIVICIIGYLVFHNKQKIIALVIEGRNIRGSRRRPSTSSYKKLDSNLEEAVTSACSSSVTHVIY